jgi:hypothetical protein
MFKTGEQVYIQTLSQFQSKLLHPAHPTSVFITGVAHKIIRASQLSSRDPAQLVEHSSDNDHLNLPNATTSSHMGLLSNWKIHVIDDPKIQNAYAIFLYLSHVHLPSFFFSLIDNIILFEKKLAVF